MKKKRVVEGESERQRETKTDDDGSNSCEALARRLCGDQWAGYQTALCTEPCSYTTLGNSTTILGQHLFVLDELWEDGSSQSSIYIVPERLVLVTVVRIIVRLPPLEHFEAPVQTLHVKSVDALVHTVCLLDVDHPENDTFVAWRRSCPVDSVKEM